MKKRILPAAGILLFAISLFANQGDELFRQANEAFQKKDFEKAAQLYGEVLAAGFRSPEVEYNLGNAHYRLGRLGPAILHYERALVLSPNDAETQHNLNLARQQVKGDIEPLPEFFLTGWWRQVRGSAGADTWGVVALLLWWGGFAGLTLWQLGKTRRRKKLGFLVGAICLIVSILPFSLAMSRAAYEQNTKTAIVLEPVAPLRSAPDDASTQVKQIFEGTKVKLLENLSGWWQVKLANGEVGWLNGGVLEEI